VKTKYYKGKRIDSRNELMVRLKAGELVYLVRNGHGKVYDPEYVIGLAEKKLDALVRAGAVYEALERKDNLHQFPMPHIPHFFLDSNNFGRCMIRGCTETKQYPTMAEVAASLSKQRNYKKGFFRI
jgi:hypothetical protein